MFWLGIRFKFLCGIENNELAKKNKYIIFLDVKPNNFFDYRRIFGKNQLKEVGKLHLLPLWC
jgi:hypothetical protein